VLWLALELRTAASGKIHYRLATLFCSHQHQLCVAITLRHTATYGSPSAISLLTTHCWTIIYLLARWTPVMRMVLVRRPMPRTLMVTLTGSAGSTIATSRRRRQWTECSGSQDVPRREPSHDADGARPDDPLLGDNVPVADVASRQIESHPLAFAWLQQDLIEASQHFDRGDVLVGGLR